VIAFDSGGVGEIVEQNTTGILVAENDSKSFVNAIIDLSQNAERRISLGKAGQLQAEKYFNKINQLPKIRNVILDLSGNRSLS
jgi:glycosyltransferase involved in cell wall biosynthesis